MNFKTLFKLSASNGPDKAMEELGYEKLEETERYVRYSKIECNTYEHIISIQRNRADDGFRIHSYSLEDFCNDALGRPIGNCGVALTDYEMEIILCKIKEMKKKVHVEK